MKLGYPIQGYPKDPYIYVTQGYANVWIASEDMVIGGITIKKGENVYRRIAGMEGHNGYDYRAITGTPLLAVHDGEIQFFTDHGYGKNVRLFFKEGDYTWECVYGHLSNYEGSNRVVRRGDIIGYVGSSGFSTGPHLHFGIRKLLYGQVIDYDNGYFGYLDPGPFFRETMPKKFIVDDNGKLGVMVLEGFTGAITFAKDMQTLENLKAAFEIPADAPIIKLP